MRHKIVLCTFCLTAIRLFAAESVLRVFPLQGNNRDMALSVIGRVVYRGDSLYMFGKTDCVLYSESLCQVGHIVYAEGAIPTDTDSLQERVKVMVYPNPTQGQLMVQNAEGEAVRIYDLQGKSVLVSLLCEGTASVDVSSLPVGTYVLMVQNGVFNIIKQ